MAYKDPADQAAAKRRFYEKNIDRYKAESAARTVLVRASVREFIVQYLSGHRCVDCGEADPIVLEFDHRGEKAFTIGNAGRTKRSLGAVIREVAKCDVRCANCHRKKTYRQLGWKSKG